MPWVGEEPLDVGRRRQLIEDWERAWINGGDVRLGAFAQGSVLGGCGLHHRCGPHGLEIGYWVDKDHLRRGVATEMARLLTTAAFTVEGITFVEIHHDEANVTSGRIAQRLGFAFMVTSPDGIQAPSEIGVEWRWRVEARAWGRLNASPT